LLRHCDYKVKSRIDSEVRKIVDLEIDVHINIREFHKRYLLHFLRQISGFQNFEFHSLAYRHLKVVENEFGSLKFWYFSIYRSLDSDKLVKIASPDLSVRKSDCSLYQNLTSCNIAACFRIYLRSHHQSVDRHADDLRKFSLECNRIGFFIERIFIRHILEPYEFWE